MTELGKNFACHGFKDVVLGGGSLAMPVLEARVMRWIDGVQQTIEF